MRKMKLLALTVLGATMVTAFAGCGKGDSKSEEQKPTEITDMNDLPNDTYCIEHKHKGETVYYPLYDAAATYESSEDDLQAKKGFDPTRIRWVNANKDEGMIPTMYQGDRLIYKTSTKIPTSYTMEKFFDDGYTIGVSGLYADESGNVRYRSSANKNNDADPGNGHTMPTSDAAGFDSLKAATVYLAKLDGKKVEADDITLSGTVKGLRKKATYKADIRTGTERVTANLKANVHVFSSAERYKFTAFDFITDHTAQLYIPDYAPSGYYSINGKGFFRYVAAKDDKDWKTMKKSAFNQTIYTYVKTGDGPTDVEIAGTTLGLTWDANDCLVKAMLDGPDEDVNKDSMTYSEFMNRQTKRKPSEKNITHKTSLKDNSGFYSADYTITSLSEPVIKMEEHYYTGTAKAVNGDDEIDFQYSSSDMNSIKNGESYNLYFEPARDTFDGYTILSLSAPQTQSTEAEE